MSHLVTVTAHLTHGIPIAGKRAKTVVIREPLLEDMIAAETEATQFSPLAFRRALVARRGHNGPPCAGAASRAGW